MTQPSEQIERALILTPNIEDGDDFYDELLRMHDGLSKAESDAFNARLILVLCNHIGDRGVISEALAIASAAPSNTETTSDTESNEKRES